MPPSFVPLRVFSAYTMLEGAIEPKAVAKQARKLGFPAAAIADRNGLYGAMAFCEAAAAAGVQPIVAALLAVARPGTPEGKPPLIDWLPLYAQDAAGYDNLCALVSAAHLDRPIEIDAHVTLDTLAGRTGGLIAATGAGDGAVTRLLAEGQADAAAAYLDRLQALFPDRLYVELARRGDPAEEAAEAVLIELADAHGLPLLATNPCCYSEPGFHAAHDVMLCIAQSAYVDTGERRRSSADSWMKPADEMARRFEDLPDAIVNTLVLAQRCAFAAPKRRPILPSLAGDRAGEETLLRRDAETGLIARLRVLNEIEVRAARASTSLSTNGESGSAEESTSFVLSEVEGRVPDASAEERASTSLSANELKEKYPIYFERLAFEVDVIVGMGFPGYFLIVADFIKWAKEQGIPVGPGRGSGAGSVVAWSLTITDLDPLKLNLLFERFLNPERVSMPDFDIDFCETRRGEVIRYVQSKYGRDQVAQIITFGKLKARAVLKDTGRVLQMSYGQVDRLAKLVPNHPTDPWTLERALNGVSELATEYRQDGQVKRLFDLAMKLEGLPRHSSTHAAGVVIGDRRLDQLVPLYRDPRSDMPVTQFDLKYVEVAGLVKFDFLGLKTLSVLWKAAQMLAARGIAVDLDTLEWDDPKVYELLQRGDTIGVFQFESDGMRRMLGSVRPTCFEDIIALGALYRPGPMDNIPMFAARKNGREPIAYPHPMLADVLSETYGIFVYQEQVMQAAQVLAGYSLGEADLLRRAMGKKIASEMAAQRQRFVDGCAANDIGPRHANELFDLIDKFAGYGFNKSHAAAYALVSYQTAWVKAHYPHEFYAASMCYDVGQTDKLAIFVEDMRRMGVACLAPAINASAAAFTVEQTDAGLAVRYALGALKGVGEKAMEELCAERAAAGPFASLEDFAARVDPRLLNRRQLESLAGGGAFDALVEARASVFAGAETILAHAAQAHDERTSGQGGLFGGAADEAPPPIRLAQAHWSLAERMAAEKEAFGFYFSAHPTDRYRHIAAAHGARRFGDLASLPAAAEGGRTAGMMAALVEEARWRTSARGRRYLIATMSDQSGQFVATCFDDAVAVDIEGAARTGSCALLTVELDRRPGEDVPRVTVRRIQPCEGLSGSARLKLVVTVDHESAIPALAEMLGRGGRGEVVLLARLGGSGDAELRLGRDFLLDAELTARIERLAGVTGVELSAAEPVRLALVG